MKCQWMKLVVRDVNKQLKSADASRKSAPNSIKVMAYLFFNQILRKFMSCIIRN